MGFIQIVSLALSISLPTIASQTSATTDWYSITGSPYTTTAGASTTRSDLKQGVSHCTPDKYIVTMIQLNWHAAYSFCEQNGWNLIKLESAEEQFELENFLNYFNLEHETFWTAGHNLEDLHNFRWDYNGLYLNYTNWDADQPDNYMGREHCIRLTEKYTKWDDYACDKRLHFICQRHAASCAT